MAGPDSALARKHSLTTSTTDSAAGKRGQAWPEGQSTVSSGAPSSEPLTARDLAEDTASNWSSSCAVTGSAVRSSTSTVIMASGEAGLRYHPLSITRATGCVRVERYTSG